jgi:hypothetical protein
MEIERLNEKIAKIEMVEPELFVNLGDFTNKVEKSRDKFEKFFTETSAKLMKIDFLSGECIKLKRGIEDTKKMMQSSPSNKMIDDSSDFKIEITNKKKPSMLKPIDHNSSSHNNLHSPVR